VFGWQKVIGGNIFIDFMALKFQFLPEKRRSSMFLFLHLFFAAD